VPTRAGFGQPNFITGTPVFGALGMLPLQ